MMKEENRMRHLVSCSDGTTVKNSVVLNLLPKTKVRRESSVLVTVVGTPVSSNVKNPDLVKVHDDPPLENFNQHVDNFNAPMENFVPPMGNFIPTMENYVPSMETYNPPVESYNQIPPVESYNPPVETYNPPPVKMYNPPPVKTYNPPRPVKTYNTPPPVKTYNPPPPVKTYNPPVETYNPPVKSYNSPVVVVQEVKPETLSVSDKVLDSGWPFTMSRISTSTSGMPCNQSAGWLTPEQLRRVASSGQYWHKFIIHRGGGYSNLEVMHALFEAVHPQTIAPVMLRREENNITFLARLCIVALLRFHAVQNKLKVKTLGPFEQETHTLDIEIVLRHTYVNNLHVNVHEHLAACIGRRHDKTIRMLDLSAFHNDQELSEVVFWALWIPKALSDVLTLLWSRVTTIRWLSLRDNELFDLPRMDILSNLEVIDLSSNKIVDINVLMALQGLNILDLTLDGNPVCAAYPDEPSYIRVIRGLLPTIKRIDGVLLIRPELPVWRRNYVPPGKTECIALVDQFLQHYFSLLDGDDLQRLQGIYHPNAIFSLTCNYVPGQSTSSSARLTRYTLESRNLLRLSDYKKSEQLLSRGSEEVLATLQRLPRTEHDPYSFTVDLPYYTVDTAVIVVNGVFREPSMSDEKLVRAFCRTFVLRKVASKEYQIINEMLSVSNASTKQAEESFQYPKPKVSLAKLSFNPAQDLTDADRKQMIKILSRLTEMKQQWARKCLQQTKWDIKLALGVFTEMLKSNKLPGEAFEPEEDKSAENK